MRRKSVSVLLVALLTILLSVASYSRVSSEGDKLDLSKTPELEAQIRQVLNRPKGDIYREELQKITQLKLSDKDLFILMDTPQLKELELVMPMYKGMPALCEELVAPLQSLEILRFTQEYPITHYTSSFPLEALKAPEKLKVLYINNHNMDNLSWLSKFPNLESLTVINSKISDIAYLQNLKALKHLDLRGNRISRIPDLTGLKGLQSLYLEGNPIKDYSSLASISKQLKEKDFQLKKDANGKTICTILAQEKVTFINKELEQQLRKQLDKTEGQLSRKELSAIKKLSYKAGNSFSEGSDVPLEDLKYFGGLESLELTLSKFGGFSDAHTMGSLKKLRSLSMTGYCVSNDMGTVFDLDWLSGLQEIKQLSMKDFIIDNWTSLGKMKKLESLNLTGIYCPESLDLNILIPLRLLKQLSLSGMALKELEALQSLTKMIKLELDEGSFRAAFDKATGKYGFFNQKGERVIKTLFQKARDFHNSYAAVMVKGKWQFINLKGQYITKNAYLETRDFSEGYAAVSDGKRWGFIDSKGMLQIPMQYKKVGDYHEGLAFASKIEHNVTYDYDFSTWGFIDGHNRFLIILGSGNPYESGELVSSFQDGIAKYIHHKHYSTTMITIDKKGNIIEEEILRTFP